MVRGNNKMCVFNDAEDYRFYLELIGRFKHERSFDLFHYTLMPNHVHLLVRTGTAALFATFMKQLSLAYFHHYRKRYSWTGHLWQGRYRSQPVGKDSYFLQCGKYVELNAPRAGLVQDPSDWPWTSYHHYIRGLFDPLITDDPFYETLGRSVTARQHAYASLAIEDLVSQSYQRPVWGSIRQRYTERQKVNRTLNRLITR
jgi:putative transposase